MKQFLERASILALSLVLITSFSISSALPAMFDYYQGYPKEQIELLASLPSFGIMIMLLLNGFLEKIFPERLKDFIISCVNIWIQFPSVFLSIP